MTTSSEQPKEYIIDNEMLLQWRTGCFRANATLNPDGVCTGCKFDNKKRGGCDFDDDAMQAIFQSRTHTPAHPPEAQQRTDAEETIKTMVETLNLMMDQRAYGAIEKYIREIREKHIALLQAGDHHE